MTSSAPPSNDPNGTTKTNGGQSDPNVAGAKNLDAGTPDRQPNAPAASADTGSGHASSSSAKN